MAKTLDSGHRSRDDQNTRKRRGSRPDSISVFGQASKWPNLFVLSAVALFRIKERIRHEEMPLAIKCGIPLAFD